MPEEIETVRHDPKVNRDIFICFETFGKREGVPIILIPGLATQMGAFRDYFCEQLAEKGFFVVRMDNRDVGLSVHLDHCTNPGIISMSLKKQLGFTLGESSSPYNLKDMATDVVALMDKIGIEKAHILGTSMGGMITQEVGINFPERCLSLVPIMTSPGGKVEGPASGTAMQLLKKPPNDIEGRIAFSTKMLGILANKDVTGNFKQEETEAYVRASLERTAYRDGFSRQLGAITQSNSGKGRQEALPGVKLPTLVIHGMQDQLVKPSNGKVIARLVPNARFEGIEGMGHDLQSFSLAKIFDLVCDWKDSYNAGGQSEEIGG